LPSLIGDIRCVAVDERLKDLEPKAWDFLINFAKDNGLSMTEVSIGLG
jgi:hypothetical protein